MPNRSLNPLLDAQTIATAEALGLNARYIVEGYMTGEHKSPFHGFSMEFTQHREYVAGDDVRHLDWKVLGRTDRYYLKQYEQETNYVAHILLDGSESMRYGSNATPAQGPMRIAPGTRRSTLSKLGYGKMMAACLAYLILHQRDAVALALFGEEISTYLPRTGNLASVHNIMAVLAAYDPRGQTHVGAVLHDVAGQIKRRGIVILISDLFDDEQQILDGIRHIRFGGSEVIVFHVMDPYELEFPFRDRAQFDGMESDGPLLARPLDIRASYLKEVEAFRQRIILGCEKNQSHYVLVDTSQPLHETLSAYLAFRQRTTG